MRTRMLLKNKGFTLIELIIVIAILAILAAAIVPNFMGFDKDARISTTKSNLETIRSRVNMYRHKNGVYPNTLTRLTDDTYDDAGAKVPYLRNIPPEMVHNLKEKEGNNKVFSAAGDSNKGGWFYDTAAGYQVSVNHTAPLGPDWGEYSAINPENW
ncbi:MAG: prepilin-type N-terminal cleavage/methylation domain-containing protein [Candidatus Omnitrophica bacterium]|nr:prepilin-type N-terminal cleavage/methylation domain-containing protein [Candidatus Omnitrophota bacterium]MDD5488545.1 prepilin-type N-terminal cleavage/methylation domain-containing protein [Candidatus Omnitrophota bacterium]